MNPCYRIPAVVLAAALLAVVAPSRGQAAAADDKKPTTEAQKIDALIASVENLKDAKFIRNGTEYDGKDAADHMRRKRKAAGDKVKTARDFITRIASKSSASGQPYKIKFKDGKQTTSEAFLTSELEKLEKPPEKKG